MTLSKNETVPPGPGPIIGGPIGPLPCPSPPPVTGVFMAGWPLGVGFVSASSLSIVGGVGSSIVAASDGASTSGESIMSSGVHARRIPPCRPSYDTPQAHRHQQEQRLTRPRKVGGMWDKRSINPMIASPARTSSNSKLGSRKSECRKSAHRLDLWGLGFPPSISTSFSLASSIIKGLTVVC